MDELFDYVLLAGVYKREKDRKVRKVIKQLMEKEKRDFEFLASLNGGKPKLPVTARLRLWFSLLLYRVFGPSFVIKMVERNEGEILEGYRRLEEIMEDRKLKNRLRRLISSTKKYESTLRSLIKEDRLKYIAFTVLGITDGLVSLLGTQAGLVGAGVSAREIGLATLVVGIAASVSLGAASYLQARDMENAVEEKAALTSSLSHFLVSVLLSAPFLLMPTPIAAFTISFFITILLTALLNYYVAVVKEKSFWKKFKESLVVILGALVVSYSLGNLLGVLLGVDHLLS